MKYAKSMKFIFGERPAAPTHGTRVFTVPTGTRTIKGKNGNRRNIMCSWDVFLFRTESDPCLVGRIKREREGFWLTTYRDGVTSTNMFHKSMKEALSTVNEKFGT